MKTISILGSGWLGLPLAEYLFNQGYIVKTSTRNTDRSPEIEAVHAIPFILDIDDFPGRFEEFLKCNILIVNITSKNSDGFARLIEEIENSPVENVLFVSSTSVYRNTNGVVFEDGGAENSESPLLKIENLFRASPRFKTTVVRFAGLIGYSRHPGRFFGTREIPQPDAPVNLIHRDDCIEILYQIIRQNAWAEVFNACTDSHPSKRDFYSYARKRLGQESPLLGRTGVTAFKIISNDKVKRFLGYQMQHPDLLDLPFE